MAGLQYYFFPTDFYYPRAESVPSEGTRKPTVVSFPTSKKTEAAADDIQKPNRGKVSLRRGVEGQDGQKLVMNTQNSISSLLLSSKDFSGSS
ncbi:hypothetical protein SLA2020_149100 [Shorea laevis]